MVASYLARVRGSGEPEVSALRVASLEQFLRECRAFHIDHAHEHSVPGDHLSGKLEDMRRRLEELLGNVNPYVVIVHPYLLPSSLSVRRQGEEGSARWKPSDSASNSASASAWSACPFYFASWTSGTCVIPIETFTLNWIIILTYFFLWQVLSLAQGFFS